MSLPTILIEDSKTIRDALVPTMQELAQVEIIAVAEGATEAERLLAAQGHRWRLAVVDLFLREGSGLSVVRACGQRQPHQRVVVLSNYATAEMRKRCLELGADAVFDKSTELDAFLEFCAAIG